MDTLEAIRLAFVGDVMLGRMVNDALREARLDYPWGDTLPIFRQSDWRACNLECAISDRGTPWNRTEKTFFFRSDAKNVGVLHTAGIDAVSVANNHILDFGYDAMADTLSILDAAGIGHAGAGPDLDAAIKPAQSKVKGVTLALIAFTDNQPEWEAEPGVAGIFYVPIDPDDDRARLLFDAVRKAKGRSGLVIVSAHWGPNWGYEPPAEHARFAHLLVECGADVVFGHSAHVFRGVELYQGRPIVYCAGNFIDDYAVDETERNDESFVFVVFFEGGRLAALDLFPTVIEDYQARRARGRRAAEIAAKMASLCGKLGTAAAWNDNELVLKVRPTKS